MYIYIFTTLDNVMKSGITFSSPVITVLDAFPKEKKNDVYNNDDNAIIK